MTDLRYPIGTIQFDSEVTDEKLRLWIGEIASLPARLLEALHQRWVGLLESICPGDFERGFLHPELGPILLSQNTQLYAWHGKHHLAHITSLKSRLGWS